MTDSQSMSPDGRALLDEIQGLRQELAALRQETQAVLGGIRALFDELRHVEASESSIELELGDVAERVDMALDGRHISMTVCESCGSALEGHSAQNGILLICKACGHTAFVDRRKTPDRRGASERQYRNVQSVSEGPPGTVPDMEDWTQERE